MFWHSDVKSRPQQRSRESDSVLLAGVATLQPALVREEFLIGTLTTFNQAAPLEMARLAAEHRRRQAASEGDERLRRDARIHFQDRQYSRVIELFESVRYPDLLTSSERKMLALAHQRAAR